MNKADKAKELASELRKSEPGIAMAFLAIVGMIFAGSLLAATIYGLMLVVGPAKTIGPLGDPGKRAVTHSAGSAPPAASARAQAPSGASSTESR